MQQNGTDTNHIWRRSTPHEPTILLVDDEPSLLDLMKALLEDEAGYRVIAVLSSGAALLTAAQMTNPPDLLILDYHLTGSPINGLEVAEILHLREGWQAIPTLVVSAAVEWLACDNRPHPLTLLAKPFDLDDFLKTVACALADSHLTTEPDPV